MTLWQGKRWPGRPTDTDQKKIFHCSLQKDRTICHAQIFSATLSYRNYHSVNSTILDYKGPQWQISGPFEAEDSVVNYCECQRVSVVVSGGSVLSYLCLPLTCIRSPPPLLAASLRCVKRKARVLSAATCPTLFTWPSEPELPTIRSLPLALWALIHFSLSLWLPGEALNARELSHASSQKPWQFSRRMNHSLIYSCENFWGTCTRRLLYAYTNKWQHSKV